MSDQIIKSMMSLDDIRKYNYWMERIGLTGREMNEIVIDCFYYPNYENTGTVGHNMKVLIAKMADYISGLEAEGIIPQYVSSDI